MGLDYHCKKVPVTVDNIHFQHFNIPTTQFVEGGTMQGLLTVQTVKYCHPDLLS